MTRQRPREDGGRRMRSRWSLLVVWAVLAAAVCLLGWRAGASGQTAVEEEYWLTVKDSKKAAEIQSYITKYPNGTYVSEARRLLDALKPPPAPTPSEPSTPPAPTPVTVELYSKTPGVKFMPKKRFLARPGETVSVRASKEHYKPVEKDILVEARDPMVVNLGPLQPLQAPTSQPTPSPQPVRPTPQPPVTSPPPDPKQPPMMQTLPYRPPASPRELTNSLGIAFVLIPSGFFMMGSTTGNPNEQPVHQVRISTAFYLGQYEVTQAQWQAVMGKNPSSFKGDPNLPVESVSWEDVQEFIRRLNARESGGRYRLPTEAEWEYAARAGSTTAYSFGDRQRFGDYAWFLLNSGGTTHPVGQKLANAWGLYDMHGNVWEWVQDVNGAYASAPFTDPLGPPLGSDRVFRGGAFSSDARGCRSASRSRTKPERRNVFLGFRLLRTVP